MCHVVWNVQLVSLLAKVKNPALCVLKELTRMKLDKVLARLVLLVHGLSNKAPNLKLIVFLSVVMALTAPVDWFLAWNVPKTVTLVNHLSMVSRNVLLALTTCLPSNLVPVKSPVVEKNVLLDTTQKQA